MDTADFKGFTHFSTHIVKKTKSDDGKALNFSDAVVFHLSSGNPFLFQVSYNHCLKNPVQYTQNEHQKDGHKVFQCESISSTQKYNACILTSKNKLDNMHSLLMWVPPIYHEFYKNLVANEETQCGIDILDRSENVVDLNSLYSMCISK